MTYNEGIAAPGATGRRKHASQRRTRRYSRRHALKPILTPTMTPQASPPAHVATTSSPSALTAAKLCTRSNPFFCRETMVIFIFHIMQTSIYLYLIYLYMGSVY